MNPHTFRQIARAPASDSEAGAAGESTSAIAQAKDSIASTARDTAARIKSTASETASRAKSEVQRLAADTKDQTASRIGGYGNAMHESAKSLEQQDPNIAWATHQMADRVQGVADYIRNTDLVELKSDVENFARRHPTAFFGGLFIGGLLIGNLLKARPETASEDAEDGDAGNQSGTEPVSDYPATTGL